MRVLMLFIIFLILFGVKILLNLYMSFGILYLIVTRAELSSMSLILPYAEVILVPLLALSSLTIDSGQWWMKPIAVLIFGAFGSHLSMATLLNQLIKMGSMERETVL